MTQPITMQVRIRAFAGVRDALGFSATQWTLAPGATVADLLAQISAAHPYAELNERRVAVAVNRVYAGPETVLAEGDEVALIPPVSGGAGRQANARLYEVTDGPLSLDEVANRIAAPDRGGVTVFAGKVRGITRPADNPEDTVLTEFLEYEAYPEMAEEVLAQIGAEVRERWRSVAAVSIVHRVGRLEIGETAVVVAVASGHRQETFAACQYAIDRVKQFAPIWKRETGSNGAVWVEGPESSLTT